MKPRYRIVTLALLAVFLAAAPSRGETAEDAPSDILKGIRQRIEVIREQLTKEHTARVEAETATARNLLLDNLGALRERLAQQDIKVDQFNVDLTDRSAAGPFDDRAGGAQDQDGNAANDQQDFAADAETPSPDDPNAGAASRGGEGTQLNVVI